MTEVTDVKKVVVHFQNIREHLRAYIKEAHYCIGAVAWLSDLDILDDLRNKKGVHIIIQNDTMATRRNRFDRFREILRAKYRALPFFPWAEWEKAYPSAMPAAMSKNPPSRICEKDTCSIRIAGKRICKSNNSNTNTKTITLQKAGGGVQESEQQAMMHHKFLFYLNERGIIYAMSTGSYNFSKNASNSYENLLYISDDRVARAYFDEYLEVLSHSMPLNI